MVLPAQVKSQSTNWHPYPVLRTLHLPENISEPPVQSPSPCSPLNSSKLQPSLIQWQGRGISWGNTEQSLLNEINNPLLYCTYIKGRMSRSSPPDAEFHICRIYQDYQDSGTPRLRHAFCGRSPSAPPGSWDEELLGYVSRLSGMRWGGIEGKLFLW